MADKVGGGGTDRRTERERMHRRANASDGNNYRTGTIGGSGTAWGTMDRVFCGLWRWWSGLGVNTVAGDARPTQSCGRSGLPHASCPTLELPAKICT